MDLVPIRLVVISTFGIENVLVLFLVSWWWWYKILFDTVEGTPFELGFRFIKFIIRCIDIGLITLFEFEFRRGWRIFWPFVLCTHKKFMFFFSLLFFWVSWCIWLFNGLKNFGLVINFFYLYSLFGLANLLFILLFFVGGSCSGRQLFLRSTSKRFLLENLSLIDWGLTKDSFLLKINFTFKIKTSSTFQWFIFPFLFDDFSTFP